MNIGTCIGTQVLHTSALEGAAATRNSSLRNEAGTCSSGLSATGDGNVASSDRATLDKYQQLRQWTFDVSGFVSLPPLSRLAVTFVCDAGFAQSVHFSCSPELAQIVTCDRHHSGRSHI